METLRAVLWRRQLQFPSRYQQACKIDTAESFSELFYEAEWEKCVENSKSQRKVPVVECLDGPARITSKELAPIHNVKKWHPPECLFCKTKSGCRVGEKCSHAHRQVDEQPRKRSKKNGDKSAVAMLKKHELYDRTETVVCRDIRYELTDPLCGTHQIHDNWVASFRIWSRRSFHQFYGRARTCRNPSDV